MKANIKIVTLFRLVLDQQTSLHEVPKRKVIMGRSMHSMLLFQAGALSSETGILFPSETDLPTLTHLPSQNKPSNKHTGRECKLDRVFLPQVESKPPRAILFWW